jgi:lipopolysaccharide export LptBFGC system permease protein LptF
MACMEREYTPFVPILWIHVWKSWARTLLVSLAALVGLLLVTRLHEAARLAALGAHLKLLALFLFYQIPELLPMVLPVSGAVASWWAMHQMSHTRQLAALRSCGVSARQQLLPCLMAAVALALVTSYITSEWATAGHRASRDLAATLTRAHPTLLIENSRLLSDQGLYTQVKNSSSSRAHGLLVAVRPTQEDPIHLLLADTMATEQKELRLVRPAIISGSPGPEGEWPSLLIDQSREAHMPLATAAQILHSPTRSLKSDHLELGLLLARRDQLALDDRFDLDVELMRRLATGLEALAICWVAAAFALHQGRGRRRGGLIPVVGIGVVLMASYFLTKELSSSLYQLLLGYVALPVAAIALALWRMGRLDRGRI